MRLVLLGDGDSPHLLKWAQALAPRVELWAASSRGFAPGFDAVLPAARRLALATTPAFEGGNVGLLRQLPRLAAWLKRVQPDWINAHYLSSHGTLAWLATRALGAPGRIAGSAWGSDILVTPEQGPHWRWLTRRVLRACALCSSDSQHMARRMQALGAAEVMVFPFGLAAPVQAPLAGDKQPALFFANRGLEPIYAPERVLAAFAALARDWPEARLVMANSGSLAPALAQQVAALGLQQRVQLVGRLDAQAQAAHYRQARWYLSLPRSDSVSVSVLEALAHGCLPILSDLPANHELVRDGAQGLILADGEPLSRARLAPLAARADAQAQANHAWAMAHAMFEPAVAGFVARLQALDAERGARAAAAASGRVG